MNCSSFRNSSTKLSEGHNWPGRSLHRRWRICWGLSSAKDQTLEFRTCKYVKTVWWLEVRNFIPRLRRSAFREFCWQVATWKGNGNISREGDASLLRMEEQPVSVQDARYCKKPCMISMRHRDWPKVEMFGSLKWMNYDELFCNPIAREGQSHSAGHRSTQDWSLCRKSMLFTLHQPRIRSRYIQTCCIRTFFFVRFSIFKRTLAVSHARLNDFLFCNIGWSQCDRSRLDSQRFHVTIFGSQSLVASWRAWPWIPSSTQLTYVKVARRHRSTARPDRWIGSTSQSELGSSCLVRDIFFEMWTMPDKVSALCTGASTCASNIKHPLPFVI